MTEPTVKCPNCGSEVRLTESLAAPMVAAVRAEAAAKAAAVEDAVRKREAAVAAEAARLKEESARLADKLATEVAAEREKLRAALAAEKTRLAADEARKAREALALEMDQKARDLADAVARIKSQEAKLAEAQRAQAALLVRERELEDARREMELTVQKRVSDMVALEREKGKKEADGEWSLKVVEKDLQLESLRKTVEELKRKMEQGSQQTQGEALEMQLEDILRQRFPHDLIEPIAKGEFGGDILQRVVLPTGVACGGILWETKRTKHWSDTWLPKLRDDQRRAKAEVSILVSAVLPKGVEHFDNVDQVWVVHPCVVLPVALSLRQMIIEVSCARQSQAGLETKMGMIYDYITGPRFKARVGAMVEAFRTMEKDLADEKRAITKQWAKREQQIQKMMLATAGLFGDVQGIAGKSVEELDGLDMRMLGE
ncbi:MAG TPA: DUF2130 domain-containing protein [Phycisphaerae bacterium]|nr:DUF2130 domain-containing protein [Phycisphaerae bacterium]